MNSNSVLNTDTYAICVVVVESASFLEFLQDVAHAFVGI